jgi:hypothetical protein
MASSAHSKREKCMHIFGQKTKETLIYKMSVLLDDLSISQRLLKLTQSGRQWTAFGSGLGLVGSWEHSNKSLDSREGEEFYD